MFTGRLGDTNCVDAEMPLVGGYVRGKPRKPKPEGLFFTPFTPYLERAMERARVARARRREVPSLTDAILAKADGEHRNIEIKARVEDRSAMAARAKAIAGRKPVRSFQEDTYFDCPEGRLKLRRVADSAELIFYKRADTATSKESRYRILPAPDPDDVIKDMAYRYGVLGRIEKVRHLYIMGNTRIHLDEVEDLGSFVEIEVVLRKGESVEQGTAAVESLMVRLGIRNEDLVAGSYIDLLIL